MSSFSWTNCEIISEIFCAVLEWQKSFSQTETPQLFNFVFIIFCFVLMEVLHIYFQYLFLKHESVQ